MNAELFVESEKTANVIAESTNLMCEIHETDNKKLKYKIMWKGSEAIDLFNKYQVKLDMLQPLYPVGLQFKYNLLNENSVCPTKAHCSDSGWDLTLIEETKKSGMVTFFSTGVSVEPPHGYYFDLVPRSSLSKTGYMLANSVGIIDQSYRGPIIAALIKIDPEAKELELPNKCVQLIMRPWYNANAIDSKLENSSRGVGSFGSTG
tara:strand:+ start:12703 stop:13317 length:615 start_codon:yes stop_codon:yes gene_type:complete